MQSALSSVHSLHFGREPSQRDLRDRHISHYLVSVVCVGWAHTRKGGPYRNGCASARIVYGIGAGALLCARTRLAVTGGRSSVGLRLGGIIGHLAVGARGLRHVARPFLEGTI